jgi:hypothetical protein
VKQLIAAVASVAAAMDEAFESLDAVRLMAIILQTRQPYGGVDFYVDQLKHSNVF